MKKLLAITAITVLFITSCSKEKEPEVLTKEKMTGTYKYAGYTFQNGTATPEDFFASIAVCEKDNLFRLNANLTYDFIDGGLKCNPSQDYSGTWSLPSPTEFNLDQSRFTVKTFDGKTLVIYETDTTGRGVVQTITLTLVRQ